MKSHQAKNEVENELESNFHIERLNMLQIQFDEMVQFSSRLVKEIDSLHARNHELTSFVSILQENSKEDAEMRYELKNQLRDMKTKLESTTLQLKKALEENNRPIHQNDQDDDKNQQKEEKNIFSRKNLMKKDDFVEQINTSEAYESFRINGITKRNRFKILLKAFSEKHEADKPNGRSLWRFISQEASDRTLMTN